MNTSFFGEMLNSITERGRALLDRARDRRGEPAASSEWPDRAVRGAVVRPRRGLGRGARRRNPGQVRRSDHRAAHRLLRGAGHPLRPRPGSAASRYQAWQASPSDKTAAEVHAAAEPRRQELLRRLNLAPGGTAALVRMREGLLDALNHRDGTRRSRRRFHSPVLVLVQPRLPGAAADRLVDAGDDPGKDHPLRGGARDRQAGTTCAGASIRRTGAATRSSIRPWSTSR